MSGIYSLVSVEKDCPEDQYIQAISYDKSCLQSMMDNLDSKTLNLANFVIKENTPVYSLLLTSITNKEHQSMLFLYSVTKFNSDKLHGFNKNTTNGVEEVLLDINGFQYNELKDKTFVKNDLSENSIVFDKYYDEGIMNA